MNFKIGKLKFAAVMVCSVIVAGSFTYVNNYNSDDVYAKTISDLEDERAANQEEINKLEQQIDDIEDKIANAEYEQSLIQQKIDLQNENLKIINTKIDDINTKLSETKEKIGELEEDIDAKEVEIEIGLEQFKERLLAMYVSGNDSLASALVGATDFYDMLSRMEFISQVAKHDDELVTNLQTTLEQYEEAQAVLTLEKEKYDADLKEQEKYQNEFEVAIETLNAEYQKSQDYTDQLAAEKNTMQANIDQYEKDNAAKQKEIDKIEAFAQQYAQQQQQSSSSGGSSSGGTVSGSSSNSSTGSGSFNGSLAWPVPGHYVISSHYGPRWGTTHRGIDIADGNTNGAAVVSSESGTVVLVATGCSHNYGKNSSCGCNGGYGNYFMVDHGNGVSTFYAHCSDVYVSVGQYVSRGQTLGTVGSTGWSTGPHLHYEVRINGSTVNPTSYLY